MKKFFLLLSVIIPFTVFSQVIPADRSVDWSLAGLSETPPSAVQMADITSFGGNGNNSVLNDQPFLDALASLHGSPGIIYFPAGIYMFDKGVVLPSNVILRGASASATVLRFELAGQLINPIDIKGRMLDVQTSLSQDANKDATSIVVNDGTLFAKGDYIKLYQNDSLLVVSDWALHTVGQILQIAEISENTIYLKKPLRRTYLKSDYPRIQKLEPVKHAGLECLTVERLDQTQGQASNINLDVAVECWIKGVESRMTNFAHVAVSGSSNIRITESYFHHAFGYGGNGQGYGVALQLTTGECLVENNIFHDLRHAMLLQAGANGNVFGYNYSFNPIRTEYPSNAGGDIVLHGNYVYANLFEGNICQNVAIDNSHGINGPYNTFFHNLVQLYGIIMNNSNPSNSQNFVGNIISNTGFLMGNYLLFGTDHLEYGNLVRGSFIPSNTHFPGDSSYYLKTRPVFLASVPSLTVSNFILPAMQNYNEGNYTSCDRAEEVITSILPQALSQESHIYPNPVQDRFFISFDPASAREVQIDLYNSLGVHCLIASVHAGEAVDMQALPDGMYIVKAGGKTYPIVKNAR